MNNVVPLLSWEAFSLAHHGLVSRSTCFGRVETLCSFWSARALVLAALRCASFEVPFCAHSSRCFLFASFEVSFYAHSSRCFLFASFEVPFCAHPVGRFSLCTLRGAFLSVREKRLLPFLRTARRCSSSGAFGELRVLCVSVFLEKNVFCCVLALCFGKKVIATQSYVR